MIQPRTNLAAILALAIGLLLDPAAASARTLEQAMDKLALNMSRDLQKANAKRVLVTVDGPPRDGATTKMRTVFTRALIDRAKVQVTNKLPDFKLTLNYSRTNGTNTYSAAVTLKDSSGQSVGKFADNFEFEIDDASDRATLDGASIDATIAADGSPQPATKENIEAKLNGKPEVFIEPKPGLAKVSPDSNPIGSVVSAAPASSFRIEILVRPKGGASYAPRGVETIDGFAFSELTEGDVYGVKVVNDADHAVAVDLSIDGLNMWTTSKAPGFKALGKFIVKPRSSAFMRGWHTGGEDPATVRDIAEFQIVEFPDSLVAELGADQSSVGQISAQFFAASQAKDEFPSVEPIGAQGPATGVGAPEKQDIVVEQWFIGKSLLAAVTIRYARPTPIDLPPE